MIAPTTADLPVDLPDWRVRAFGYAVAFLRVGFGLVFLTNGLAKVAGIPDLSILPGFLIDLDGAEGILRSNTSEHPVGAYKELIDNVVLENWDFFAVLLTASEIFIGLSLVLGAFASVGAMMGALFTIHINFSTLESDWRAGPWAWEGAVEWIPLGALAFMAAGRYWGLDRWIARRLPPSLRRWPVSG